MPNCINIYADFYSNTGPNIWKGKDVETGEYVYISMWSFAVKDIERKCPMSCAHIAQPLKCEGHENAVNAILEEFHERANFLIKKVKHENLVRYVGVDSSLDAHSLKIRVAQEFVDGESIRSIYENGKLLNIFKVGKEMLESIIYLQKKSSGITHGYLNADSVYLDNSGVCRITMYYDLIPYLMYLNGWQDIHKESDLNSFGKLIQQLSGMMINSLNDFVAKFCSGRISCPSI